MNEAIVVPFVLKPSGGNLDPQKHDVTVNISKLQSPDILIADKLDVASVLYTGSKAVLVCEHDFGTLPPGKYVLQVRLTHLTGPSKGDWSAGNYHLHVGQ